MKTNRKRLWKTSIVASFLLAVLLVGCKKDDYVEIVGVCPAVELTNPRNGAVEVPINQIVTATFNQEMDPTTFNQQSFTLLSGAVSTGPIPGILTYNNTNATLSFVPSAPLSQNTTYTATIKSSVKDLNGNALQTNYVWTFSTGSILSPTVISTDPANMATAVFVNKVVTASFSVPMDPLTIIGATFTLKQGASVIAGTVSYSGITASFIPSNELISNTTYTATITSGAKNIAGTPLENNYVWTFTTGSITGPTVISTDPTNNASGVMLSKTVTASFSQAMDPSTLTASTFTVKQGLATITGTVSYSGTTASFTPTSLFEANTLFVGTITTGAKNIAGIPLTENYVWSFTTEIIGAAPTVILTDPVNNATGVLLNKRVTATFSTAMNPLTLTNSSFTIKKGLVLIPGTISYSGTSVSFDPTSAFESNTLYAVTITTGAQNLAGISLAADYIWSFTTGSIVGPTVISTDPSNNETGVFLNKTVAATFSTAMDPLTITTSTFIIKKGSLTINGTVSYSGTTASFLPSSPLEANSIYECTITTGAKNEAGIPLAGNYVWSFTTETLGASPTVILTDPLNNATGVPLNKTVTAAFDMAMDPLTLTSATFIVKKGLSTIAGTVSYAGTIASFIPTNPLETNSLYTVTISTAAQNVAGIPMAADYIWSFTTIPLGGPTVILTDPLNNATGVLLNKTVTASFNMAMNPLTLTSATFIVKKGLTTISGLVSYAGTTASFIPTNPFEANSLYTVTITTGAMNLAGTPMAADYIWSFTTIASGGPTVISTDPMNNAIGVALNKVVTATFSEAMNPLTITNTSFTLNQGTNPITGIVSYSGITASFTPSAPLLANTIYTATLTTAVTNAAGVPIASNYVWTFTTLSVPAPMVTSTDPLNNATGVALNKVITASFNMPMDPLTLTTSTFVVKKGLLPITGLVSYSGTTASFTPSSALLSNTVYTATITNGAMNTNGIPMVSDFVWSFTTLNVPTIDLGTVGAFGAFGGNAGITNQGINTVINGAIATTAASTLVTGFHDGMTGDVYTETPLNVGLVTNGIFTAPPFPGTTTNEAIATQALIDANAAYQFISPGLMPGGIDPGAGELGGLTLAPGVYTSASGTFNISNGPLTLDAQGDPNATWVFQTAAGLTVGIAGPTGARSVILVNGALPKNVFWYVGSAATINGAGGGIMVGTIIATAGVTFSTPGNAVQTVLNGRAISLIASVTMVNTTINVPE